MAGTEQTGKARAKKKSKKKGKAKPAIPEQQEEILALTTPDSGVDQVWALEAAKGVDNLMRVAEIFANSGMVPDRYKKKKEDCAIVIAMALKHGADILGFMQSVYVVYGTPGMESKLAIGLVNNAGVFKGPIQYDFTGDEGEQNRKCTAWAISSRNGARCEKSCSIKDANRHGWTKPVPLRNGKGSMPSKWTVMPEQMLAYRAAMNMIRLYHPEILLGMKTVAELEDIGPREVDIEILPPPHRDEIRDAVSSATASPTQKALAPPDEQEKPLSESIAESSTPVAGAQQGGLGPQRPADEGSLSAGPAPDADADGQTFLGTTGPTTLPPDDQLPAAPAAAKPAADKRFAVIAEDAPEPTTDEEMRAERVAVVTLYSDLARQAGEERMNITSTMTGTLKEECRRLIKDLGLTHLLP